MHTNNGIVYETMDPWGLHFLAAALSETEVSSECRTVRLPTSDPPI